MPDKILDCGDPGAPGLWRHVKDESVDLVYLDPPFKSNQDYPGAPGLFAERDGTRAAAQIKVFEDPGAPRALGPGAAAGLRPSYSADRRSPSERGDLRSGG